MKHISTKKILVISTVRYRTNGISSVIHNLYVNDVFKDAQVTFVFPVGGDETMEKQLVLFGFKVEIISRKNIFSYIKRLKRIMKQNSFDAIHVHGNSSTIFLEIHLAKKYHIPVRIAHSHNSYCKHRIIHKIFKPLLNKEITHPIACSDVAGRWLFYKNFTIIPNTINAERFKFDNDARKQARNSLGLKNEIVIGNIGNMVEQKNQLYLINFFSEICKLNDNFVLIIIGDGALKDTLKERIVNLHLEKKVFLLGKRYDVDKLYQAMDIFVLPSLFEGFPIVLIEAQTSGLPCYVSNVVTHTSDLTGNVHFLPIGKDSISIWASAVLNNPIIHDRLNGYEIIKNSCYNSLKSSEELLDIINNS